MKKTTNPEAIKLPFRWNAAMKLSYRNKMEILKFEDVELATSHARVGNAWIYDMQGVWRAGMASSLLGVG